MKKTGAALFAIAFLIGFMLSLRPQTAAARDLAAANYDLATTCYVSLNGHTTTDYFSSDATAFQAAVNAATPGDTLKLAGSCTGVQAIAGISQTVYITKSLTLLGGYNQDDWAAGQQVGVYTTTLDANGLGRVAYLSNGASVTLDGLVVTNGAVTNTQGAGIAVVDADVTINQSVIRDSKVISGAGGGIYANRPITISNSTIYSNVAKSNALDILGLGYGGGLYAPGAQLNNTRVISNFATVAGGGIVNNGGLLTVQNDSRIEDNDSSTWGGGIFNLGGRVLLNDSSQVSLNSGGRGGGIYTINTLTQTAYVTLTGSSQVYANWSAFFAGGIFNRRYVTDTLAIVTLANNSQVLANESDGDGGGVYNWGFSTDHPSDGATLYLLDNSQIISNTGKNGGGVYLYQNSVITSTGGALISNTAREKGGAVYIRDGSLYATDSSIQSNVAITNGGGLYLERGTVSLGNSQVVENQAGGYAGGIYVDAGTLLMSGGRIGQNQSYNAGGGLVLSNGALTLTGTEVISNVSVNAHAGRHLQPKRRDHRYQYPDFR